MADPLIWEHEQYWTLGNTPFEREAAYKLLLAKGLSTSDSATLAKAADTGWPLGKAEFVDLLQQSTNRPLAPRPRGRRPTRT